jgi:hypothetical protein
LEEFSLETPLTSSPWTLQIYISAPSEDLRGLILRFEANILLASPLQQVHVAELSLLLRLRFFEGSVHIKYFEPV